VCLAPQKIITTWRDTSRYNATYRDTTRHIAIQRDTTRYNAIQRDTTRYKSLTLKPDTSTMATQSCRRNGIWSYRRNGIWSYRRNGLPWQLGVTGETGYHGNSELPEKRDLELPEKRDLELPLWSPPVVMEVVKKKVCSKYITNTSKVCGKYDKVRESNFKYDNFAHWSYWSYVKKITNDNYDN
jgi:hypothetical protein